MENTISPPRPDADQKTTLSSFRWTVCALLFFATTINYIDRQILSLLKPILDVELGWTNAQYGMVNSAFQGAYAVGLLGFGWFVDRFGTKVGYSVSIALWSLAAMCHALVGSVAGFRWARVFLGVSEAGNFPSAIKTVAIWFPRSERAFATSLFNSGANVGALIAPAVIPVIAATWGWRSAFVAAGIAGFVWLVFWSRIYRSPAVAAPLQQAEGDALGAESATEAKLSVGSLLCRRQTWSFIVAKFLTDPVWWFFLIWLPDYFSKTKGLDIKKIGVPIIAIYGIITVLAIAGGWLGNFLVRRGWSNNAARKSCMLLFALCVLPVLLVKDAGLWGAVVIIGVAGSAHQAWSANLFTTVSDMFPKRAVASVVGIGSMAGSIGGILFPIYSGRLLDRFTALGHVNDGYGVLFAVCAFAYIVAYIANHILAPRFNPIEEL